MMNVELSFIVKIYTAPPLAKPEDGASSYSCRLRIGTLYIDILDIEKSRTFSTSVRNA